MYLIVVIRTIVDKSIARIATPALFRRQNYKK